MPSQRSLFEDTIKEGSCIFTSMGDPSIEICIAQAPICFDACEFSLHCRILVEMGAMGCILDGDIPFPIDNAIGE